MKVFANILLLAISAMLSQAHAGSAASEVTVTDAWVRAVPPITKMTAGYLQLKNTGSKEHMLIAAESQLSGAIELHSHEEVDGMMQMRMIPHVHLPPGKNVALKPGGMHLMMFRLTRPTQRGTTATITLTFSDGSTQNITAEIR
ncbi:MAG: copper chaperone PCu(A)C [bacterium]